MSEQNPSQATNANKPEFAIQRMYLKDVSFESPNTPEVFLQEWKPDVNIQLNNESSKLDDNTYHVLLDVTVTVKRDDKVVFLVEVKQAGIFSLKNFSDDQIKPVLGSYCPSILYPYARETISNLCVHGGFPALYLAHINFDAIYAEKTQREQQQAAASGSQTTTTVQ